MSESNVSQLKPAARAGNRFFELESDLLELHCMVQLTVMAAKDEDDELTRFGVYQVEKRTEVFKHRFYELYEQHVGRQSA